MVKRRIKRRIRILLGSGYHLQLAQATVLARQAIAQRNVLNEVSLIRFDYF